MFGSFDPPVRSTLTCSCGAKIVIRAYTYTEAAERQRDFLAAHKPCVAASATKDQLITPEEGTHG
jgi:hypothetical protein